MRLNETELKCHFTIVQVTTPSSMMFDDKSRKAPSSTLLSKPPVKLTTPKPKSKLDIVEPEIDIDNAPILQGSFEVTKTDADITEKKVRTSTLKPFTITNGSVRMKPKKTTIEKVKPLPKVPENLTGNILKLENVTRPYLHDIYTTIAPMTTTEEIATTGAIETSSYTEATSTAKIPITTPSTTTTTTTTISYQEMSSTTSSTTEATPISVVFPSEVLPSKPVENLSSLEGEIITQDSKKNSTNVYPSTIVLDEQPWLPIQPNVKINDVKKKIHAAVIPPAVPASYNTDPVGFQLQPRNKLRNPIPIQSSVQKTGRPTVYHGYNNPALMYGLHEVERLGGYVKPYPLPVDLIGEQSTTKKDEDLILNKGEVLPSIKETNPPFIEVTTIKVTPTPTPTPAYEKSNNKTDGNITLNIEETTEVSKNKTDSSIEEDVSNQQVGDILRDLLKGSNANLNDTNTNDLTMQSRTDDLDLPGEKSEEIQNQTDNLPEEIDHTEALDEIATVLSSMETLSFKNIKDYIMATTKSIGKEILSTSTEREETTARREKPQNIIDPMVKSDRISLVAPTTPVPPPPQPKMTEIPIATTKATVTMNPMANSQEISTEPVTTSFVEIETVQYTPGAASWSPGLFPVQSKWEYVNGSIVYPSVAPMRKVFNETLQAWIIENPREVTERPPPTELIRNSTEPLKNISAIFDTLASKLSINTMETAKLPPFMSHFSANKHKNNQHASLAEYLPSTTIAPKRPVLTTATPPIPSTVSTTPTTESELPILLNQNTESYYGSSAETLIGEAEVEEVDPTQYEQMLLIDRVSAALRPTSTVPSLVTLMPVKSNSGIRTGFINEKLKGSARGFPPSQQSTSSNKRRFEDASFVVRTSMNISS